MGVGDIPLSAAELGAHQPKPSRKYRLTFRGDDDPLDGLIVRVSSISSAAYLTVLESAALADIDVAHLNGNPQAMVEAARQISKGMNDLIDAFQSALVEWNMRHPDTGELVPTTREGLTSIDFKLLRRIIQEWTERTGGVDTPLKSASLNGETFPDLPMPMEVLPGNPGN